MSKPSPECAIAAFELGTFIAEFRVRFQHHAFTSERELKQCSKADTDRLKRLLDQILGAYNRLIATLDRSKAEVFPSLYVPRNNAYLELDEFFNLRDGEENHAWQAIINDYTRFEEYRDELDAEQIEREFRRLLNKLELAIPEVVSTPQTILQLLQLNFRPFFVLGLTLTRYAWGYCSDAVLNKRGHDESNPPVLPTLASSITSVNELIQECARLLPEAKWGHLHPISLESLYDDLVECHTSIHGLLKSAMTEPNTTTENTGRQSQRPVESSIGSSTELPAAVAEKSHTQEISRHNGVDKMATDHSAAKEGDRVQAEALQNEAHGTRNGLDGAHQTVLSDLPTISNRTLKSGNDRLTKPSSEVKIRYYSDVNFLPKPDELITIAQIRLVLKNHFGLDFSKKTLGNTWTKEWGESCGFVGSAKAWRWDCVEPSVERRRAKKENRGRPKDESTDATLESHQEQ